MIALRYHRAVTPDAVRKLRQRLGLSQSKFAALLGVHKVSVAKWEVGLLGMSATTDCLLRVLAQARGATDETAPGVNSSPEGTLR